MMDVFIIATFMILAATVVMSIVVDKLNRAGRKDDGDRLDRISRWAFPLCYTLVAAVIALKDDCKLYLAECLANNPGLQDEECVAGVQLIFCRA